MAFYGRLLLWLMVVTTCFSSLVEADDFIDCLEDAATDVLTSGDEFNQERLSFNLLYNHVPKAVVMAQSTTEVQAVMKCVTKYGVAISVRGGGHSYAGFSTSENGLLLDVSNIDGLSFDSGSGVLTVGAGAMLGDLYTYLWNNYKRGVPCGTCHTVGVAGHAMGGGYGMASRTYGLFQDSILEYQVVDYKGDVLVANAKENQDLYWAMRGAGGGNFGVLVELKVQTYDMNFQVVNFSYQLFGGTLRQLSDMFASIQTWAPAQDEKLNIFYQYFNSNGGWAGIYGNFFGSQEEFQSLIAGGPLADLDLSISQSFYPPSQNDPDQDPNTFVAASHYIMDGEWLSSDELYQVLETAQSLQGSIMLQYHAYGNGSAINQIAPDATANYHRNAAWSLQTLSWLDGTDVQTGVDKFNSYESTISPIFDTDAGYRCYPYGELDREAALQSYYGANVDRLQQVKATYDPYNIFDYDQGVLPDGKQPTGGPPTTSTTSTTTITQSSSTDSGSGSNSGGGDGSGSGSLGSDDDDSTFTTEPPSGAGSSLSRSLHVPSLAMLLVTWLVTRAL